jgi:hemerythrin-like domain-containing protein
MPPSERPGSTRDIIDCKGELSMEPIRRLMAEHQVILKMTANMARRLETFRDAGHVDTRYIETATDFIRTYADHCHHGKEEGILFRELGRKELDPKVATLMGQLLQEHTWARTLTGRLVEANRAYALGDASQLDKVLRPLRQLADFYPGHITKEESRFFEPCATYFTEGEREAMLAEFSAFDQTLIHERYRALVEEAERELGD